MFNTRHEVRRLEATVAELREALRESWERRTALTAEVEALRARVDELRADAPEASTALAADRERLRRQIDSLLGIKAGLVDRLDTARGDVETVLARLNGATTSSAEVEPSGAGRVHAEETTLDHLFDTHVVLEADRLYDFVAISMLERALAGIEGVSDVHVRRVDGSRAVLDVELLEPARLLRLLDGSLPADADVTAVAPSHLSLSLRDR